MHSAVAVAVDPACDAFEVQKRGRGRPPVNPRLLAPWARRMRALIAASTEIRNREHLCALVGIHGSNLYKYEKRERHYEYPPLELLLAIAEVLHVTLDQLYPTGLPMQEPDYAGWHAFLETDLGRSMNDDERRDLAGVRFQHRAPTKELYTQLLIGYRGFTVPFEPPSADGAGVELMPPVKVARK